MSGDVQPRKRKDKKKKKDELGLEEPRGTAAALGEGDVFMHSYSDHGTGGHWCAKIIFFSLLAVLLTLIGLIILENRGLSELEANAVESRYSNILEGWLEDAPDDDHHDAHTLELKHHDDDEEDDHYDSHDVGDHEDEEHEDEDDHEHVDEDEDEHADEDEDEHADEDEDEHADEDENEHADDDENDEEEPQEDDDAQNDDGDSQQELEEADDEDEDDRSPYKYYAQDDEEDDEEETKNFDDADGDDEEDGDDDKDDDEPETAHGEDDEQNDDHESNEELENDEEGEERLEGDEDEETNENDDDEEDNQTGEDEEEHDDHEDDDDEVEVEKIEQEASEEEPITHGLPVLPEEDDDDDEKDKDDHDDAEDEPDDDDDAADDDDDADDDFLEADVPPVVERVTAPAGKPFVEVDEDDVSTEAPPNTLEEEEEYEKQQEEKRKEEEQSSHHIWLKLSVGAALLVATHAVLRRATAPRDEAEEERVVREETPVDRRMTLIPEETALPVIQKKEIEKPVVEEIVRREAPVVKSPPVVSQQDSEEEDEEPELEEIVEEEEIEEDEPEQLPAPKKEEEKKDKELYSDEEEEEEEIIIPKKEAPKAAEPAKPAPEPEDEDPDDVEIIDDEQLEEELEEEEVSDVDDSELLSRLEAKYGRLPEPERPGQRHKEGGNSVEDAWPGEPADAYWRQQLDSAERDLRQGAWAAAAERAGAAQLRASARARFVLARALDRLAEARRDNDLLTRAIAAYFDLLQMSEQLSDNKLVAVARRTLDRIQFRGNYLKAEPVYRILIRRFPDEPGYRNNLTISFLMANRNDLAEKVLKETLALWPDDRVALVHYAFILKTTHKDRLEEAVELFQRALEGDEGPACEGRFYYHYGDALLLLGRFEEAHEVHKRGAKLGHFLSAAQRSLYNVPRLKSRPWWNVDETPYAALARNLEKRWKEIYKEGMKAAKLYEEEKEGLRERGEWSQMDLFVRGREIPGRCAVAPATCAVVRGEPAAAACRRGQVKFSLMAPGTHVRPHVGPTNCRLRMHLALSNTNGTFIRVDQETRQWQEGKVLLFDDSFEHEVWHNGTAVRLVLIVDVWHPDLTAAERRTLPPI